GAALGRRAGPERAPNEGGWRPRASRDRQPGWRVLRRRLVGRWPHGRDRHLQEHVGRGGDDPVRAGRRSLDGPRGRHEPAVTLPTKRAGPDTGPALRRVRKPAWGRFLSYATDDGVIRPASSVRLQSMQHGCMNSSTDPSIGLAAG